MACPGRVTGGAGDRDRTGVGFDPGGAQYQFVESRSWIPRSAQYALGVDGIALALVVLTAVLVPLLLIAGWNDADEDRRRATHRYVALMLLVEAMVMISFTALDILLFYIFFEAMLIPMYFLIGGFGGPAEAGLRSRAAVKFLLYNLAGGLIMLAAVIGLYVATTDMVQRDIRLPGDRRGHLLWIARHRPDRGQVIVPRLHVRVRGQGPAVALAHLAPGCGSAGHPGRRGTR